jgi:hypothetical protein
VITVRDYMALMALVKTAMMGTGRSFSLPHVGH